MKSPISLIVSLSFFLFGLTAQAGLFENNQPLEFRLSYDAKKLREAKLLAGVIEDRDPLLGDMTFQGIKFPVTMTVKGMSSPSELEFPKLKIDIPEKKLAASFILQDTPFEGESEFSLQTHGYNQDHDGQWTLLGRLRSSKWVFREGAIYNLLKSLGLPVRRIRHAFVSYDSEKGTIENKPALLLEKMSKFAKSIGAQKVKNLPLRYVEDKSISQEQRLLFDVKQGLLVESEVVLAKLMNIMVGNSDFEFPSSVDTNQSVHNINILKHEKTGKIIVTLEDFDMASAVTGLYTSQKKCSLPPPLKNEDNLIKNKVWCQLQLLCSRHLASDITKAIAQSLALETKALNFHDSMIDKEGAQLLQTQIRTYYEVMKQIRVSGEKAASCELKSKETI